MTEGESEVSRSETAGWLLATVRVERETRRGKRGLSVSPESPSRRVKSTMAAEADAQNIEKTKADALKLIAKAGTGVWYADGYWQGGNGA